METEIIIFYLVIINILSAVVCAVDKILARHNSKNRISEKTLFALCFLGGTVGMYITMKIMHHKTRHKRFMIGIPVIFLLQIVVCFWYLEKIV